MANLAGPALLLAAGLRPALRGVPMFWYISGYTVLFMAAGELRLWMTGFHRLAAGWFVMAFCIGVLLLILRRFWLWEVVGGLWSAVLLGIWSTAGIVAYASARAPLFPNLLVIQIVGAVMALVVGLLHVRLRRRAAQSSTPSEGTP